MFTSRILYERWRNHPAVISPLLDRLPDFIMLPESEWPAPVRADLHRLREKYLLRAVANPDQEYLRKRLTRELSKLQPVRKIRILAAVLKRYFPTEKPKLCEPILVLPSTDILVKFIFQPDVLFPFRKLNCSPILSVRMNHRKRTMGIRLVGPDSYRYYSSVRSIKKDVSLQIHVFPLQNADLIAIRHDFWNSYYHADHGKHESDYSRWSAVLVTRTGGEVLQATALEKELFFKRLTRELKKREIEFKDECKFILTAEFAETNGVRVRIRRIF